MFTGHASMIPQIEIPAAAPQFDHRIAVDARSIFPEEDKRPPVNDGGRPHGLKLLDCRQSEQQNAFLAEYHQLCDRIDAFVAHEKAERISELERQRDAQRILCRSCEDSLKEIRANLASASQRVNDHATVLNAAKHRFAETERRPFDTAYPTAQEVQQWAQKRSDAKATLEVEQQRAADLGQSQIAWGYRFEEEAKKLNEADEQLRAIDRELKNLK
jgi:hypothetical protein